MHIGAVDIHINFHVNWRVASSLMRQWDRKHTRILHHAEDLTEGAYAFNLCKELIRL
jgi:sterol desaturase/sphingolipid hydroxylase (fatty acid hydroxylase superfamily)